MRGSYTGPIGRPRRGNKVTWRASAQTVVLLGNDPMGSIVATTPLPVSPESSDNPHGGSGQESVESGDSSSESAGERNGRDDAGGEPMLVELYAELRRRAERFMRGQPRDLTLQTTALVHEACLKIFGEERLHGADRAHLLALGASAMRSVLIDHARARGRVKRLPPGQRVPIDDLQVAYEDRAVDLVALDEALARLTTFDPIMARAVELHFFGGLSLEETARVLELPLRTLERRWAATRAWLRKEIS